MNPNSPLRIRKKTQEILFTEYYPWLKKRVRSFLENNKKQYNRIMEIELYQHAIKGFLEAIYRFDGHSSLVKYASKYVDGQIYIGFVELTPLKPISRYQKYVKKRKILKPTILSYDNYWLFDKFKQYEDKKKEIISKNGYIYSNETCFVKENSHISHIRSAVLDLLPEQQKLFFMRYDFETLRPIKSVYQICRMMQYSDETYRTKMNIIKKFIRLRLRKMIF